MKNNSEETTLFYHDSIITRKDHEIANGHRGIIIWLTGLSGAGKSTVAHAVEKKLFNMNCQTIVLDGDTIRTGLSNNLTFSDTDRTENIRRTGEVSKLFLHNGTITITAFISPFKSDREFVRNLVSKNDFIEVYCNAPLKICEERDSKGLYKKARDGLIKNYTGISSLYEEPENPELVLNTGHESLEKSVGKIIELLKSYNVFN